MIGHISRQQKAYLFACIAIFFWSTIATAFKLSLEYLGPVHLVFYATLVSVIVLFFILLFQGKLKLISRFSAQDFLRFSLLGILNPCLYYIILLHAYDLLPAQEAMAINYSWVVMMVILSIPILKQKIRLKEFLSIILSYIGVVLIATKGDILALEFESIKGVSYALITTVIWALFWLFNTKHNSDTVVSLFLIFLFSLPFIAIVVYLDSGFIMPSVNGLIGATYIGLFEMGITFVLWQSALRLSSSVARVSSLVFITPFLALLIVQLVLREVVLTSTVFGVVLIISGLLLQKYFTKQRTSR
ncbi:MAG TPA: DMT family transporter [Gammaproteobacteria bacterium]|jgi:drug/metabolite transporter (DMT)-like permease|nr:DMT family transporter [Gammaproteobacteria bacterium]|tara:strand:+ start:246 stop:1151 length:906 start_codon:yes stop_codon:yes gene_type:complete